MFELNRPDPSPAWVRDARRRASALDAMARDLGLVLQGYRIGLAETAAGTTLPVIIADFAALEDLWD